MHGLTARELQILRELATGKTNREIAEALVISDHTVRRHIQNIFAKLGVCHAPPPPRSPSATAWSERGTKGPRRRRARFGTAMR